MKELYSNGSASSIQMSSLFQLSQSILFLLLLSLLLLVFFVPFPTLNEKVKPNKKEAKCYNPTKPQLGLKRWYLRTLRMRFFPA